MLLIFVSLMRDVGHINTYQLRREIMIKSYKIALIVLGILSIPYQDLSAQTAVACQPGASPQWKSGWCDFGTPVSFNQGERLRLAVGGSAKQIIVRLLPRGTDSNTTIGVYPTLLNVPENRFVEFTVPNNTSDIVQISVHGGPNPFGQYPINPGNGPATISGVERLPETQ